MNLRLRFRIVRLAWLLPRTLPWFAVCAAVSVFAAASANRAFRVQPGDAASTLREFATQAAEQVVFPADAVPLSSASPHSPNQ